MTKKDYNLAVSVASKSAGIFRADPCEQRAITDFLTRFFARDSANFDPSRFRSAMADAWTCQNK